ncbi:MAG: type II toxin-antitoxin system prevent-host-death family antitoxin [Candidatus Levybacteria bacterium]|nr:type II toxin-antitoxin system prevent-host-death family antitoxin [Candidatus Levybacteria bacterium]
MNTIRLSATATRNKFFELLNQVALGTHVIIEKDSKEVAVLSPKKQTVDWTALRKASKAVHGIWKDYDEKDNPLRRPGAWPTLGKWDK